MPKKKTSKTSSRTRPVVRRPHVSSSQGASYDTLMIITVLLLIFVYPVGIVFMWILMRTWPTWLKLVITLPLLIGVFFTVLIAYVVGRSIGHGRFYGQMRTGWQYERMHQQNMINLTPTPAYTF